VEEDPEEPGGEEAEADLVTGQLRSAAPVGCTAAQWARTIREMPVTVLTTATSTNLVR
jgi:hypothetical protein